MFFIFYAIGKISLEGHLMGENPLPMWWSQISKHSINLKCRCYMVMTKLVWRLKNVDEDTLKRKNPYSIGQKVSLGERVKSRVVSEGGNMLRDPKSQSQTYTRNYVLESSYYKIFWYLWTFYWEFYLITKCLLILIDYEFGKTIVVPWFCWSSEV